MERLSLKQRILNVIDNSPRGYSEELAKIACYSSGSALKKVLRDPKKDFDKFNGLIEMVRFLFPENEYLKVMADYSLTVDPNKKTSRLLLEFFAMNRQFEAFNELIERMLNCSNKESNEWAKMYQMQYKYELANKQDDYEILIKEINEIKTSYFEVKVYKSILLNHCYNQLSDFARVKFLSDEIDSDVQMIENEYIKMTYSIRSNQIKSYNYLKVYNNPEAARKSSDEIIESEAKPSFKAYAFFIKGLSYLFTSYEKTIEYLNKGIEIYTSLNRYNDANDLKEKVEFASVYWNKVDGNEIRFLNNKLLFEVKKGNDINSNLTRYKNEISKEFYLYLEGLNTKNEKKLMLSLIKYIKKNDLFLANLPKIELYKMGYDEEILEELLEIKMA